MKDLSLAVVLPRRSEVNAQRTEAFGRFYAGNDVWKSVIASCHGYGGRGLSNGSQLGDALLPQPLY